MSEQPTTSGTTASKGATGPVSSKATQNNAPQAQATQPQAEEVQVAQSAEEATEGGVFVEAPTTTVRTESSDEADARRREEEAARVANPDKVVYRDEPDATFFEVGQVVRKDEDA